MPRLIHREFDVSAGLEHCWEHLARVEAWPSWARHIRSVELTPPGGLTAASRGSIRLTNGIRSSFAMSAFQPGERWEWTGRFLWLRVRYDHAFERLAGDRTRIVFDVDVEGLGANTLGRVFARIYSANLDRAIPNLVAEIEAGAPSA